MADGDQTGEPLAAELTRLRRRLSELEKAAADHQRTEQRLASDAQVSLAALRRSEATAQAILESASEGILLVDTSGRITLANAAALRMFGYDHAELIGQPLEILLPDRIRVAHADHRMAYFAEPRVRPMGIGLDLSGRRRDGAEFPVEISLSSVETSDGVVAMAFITDITERKRAEGQLQRQREVLYQNEKLAALGTLSAGIAHEMNNPLGIMTTRIEVMLLEAEEQQLPPQVLEDLQVLHRAGQRVARIAASLRSFARQSAGERQPVELGTIVDEALLLMAKPLAADNVRVRTSLDRSLPPIVADVTAMHQVLMNLLTNAREAMPDGGTIDVETSPAERPGWVRLRVADTGTGIPTEAISKVFDPFYTTKRTGTGLGLSVTYGIIEEHGGTIDVRSQPGLGTTFTLEFPAAPSPAGRTGEA
jgi:PAS domain S-box-containing protein